jgi:hypothetical protein
VRQRGKFFFTISEKIGNHLSINKEISGASNEIFSLQKKDLVKSTVF